MKTKALAFAVLSLSSALFGCSKEGDHALDVKAVQAATQKPDWFTHSEKEVGHSKLDMDNMFKAN